MGEYYAWVNVDRKEYISPSDFNYGNKFHESINKDSAPLYALHILLSDEWKGDRVVWFGDEKLLPKKSPYSIIQKLYDQSVEFGYPGEAFGMICDSYRNISCCFKEAEECVREEIGYYLEEREKSGVHIMQNEYRVDLDHPFDGLFQKIGRRFQYIINHTKEVYYSLSETKILYQDHTECDFADPLPVILGYGKTIEPGIWLGDIIGVDDKIPDGYKLLDEIYLNW